MRWLIGLVILAGLAWFGMRLRPRRFPPFVQVPPPLKEAVPIPPELPAPVQRFFHAIAGEQVPVLHSAVITLSGTVRIKGITLPARARFTHDGRSSYRHYIVASVFGLPLLQVNEHYLDGRGRMELPFGTVADHPKLNQAANMGLWGEIAAWLPTILITDTRVRWEALDAHSARLIVPFEDTTQTFTVIFDPQTGLIARMETLRWRDVNDQAPIRWILEPLGWDTFQGIRVPSPAGVTWEDEGTPWLVVHVDEIAYNVDVSQTVRARGL